MPEGTEERLVEDDLQQQLRDLLCLAVVGDHVRWVATGGRSGELVDWLIGATTAWRSWGDAVAKQLAASGVAPDGRIRSLAKDIPVNWVPGGWLEADAARALVADRLAVVSEWARYRRSQNSGLRAQLLDVICSGFDEQHRALQQMAAASASPSGTPRAQPKSGT